MHRNEKKAVLVVDDDETIRAVLKKYFTDNFDVNIVQAKDGSEASFKIKNQSFDLIVLDLKIPKINGIELIKEVNVENPNASLVVLSGAIDKQFLVNVKKKKLDAILTKPITKEKLDTKIRNLLE